MTRNTRGFLVAAAILTSGALASQASDASAQACGDVSEDTNGGVSTFVIPEGCEHRVSLSAYECADATCRPYESQTFIAHAPGSGQRFGPGEHTLTVDTGDACFAQVDLYFGPTQDTAPHPTYIGGERITRDCDAPAPTPAERPQPELTPRAPAPTPVPTLPPAVPEPTPRVKLIDPPPVATPWVPAALATPTASPTPVPTAPPAVSTPEAPTPARTGHGYSEDEGEGQQRFAYGLGALSLGLLGLGRLFARRRGQ